MEHKVKFNRKLFWDYQITQKDLENEDVFIFYLSRVLNNGSFQDITEIPVETIKKYLKKLHLASKVRKFWEWYLPNLDPADRSPESWTQTPKNPERKE